MWQKKQVMHGSFYQLSNPLPTWLDLVVLLCKALLCTSGQQADVLSIGEAEAAKNVKDTGNRSHLKIIPITFSVVGKDKQHPTCIYLMSSISDCNRTLEYI